MNSNREQFDNFRECSQGCLSRLTAANISAMSPGTSTSTACTNVLYSQPSAGTGKLKTVTLQITPMKAIITFQAAEPWSAIAVSKSDNDIHWDFTEWVPHHRPIFNDNHDGTTFPARPLTSKVIVTPSRHVYFKHFNQIINGAYSFSSTKLVLSYQVADLRMLGVRTPFTWVGSEGFQKCSAALAK
jgi:hypothetical protein